MKPCRSLPSLLAAFFVALPIASTAEGISGLSADDWGGAKMGGDDHDLVLNEEGGGEPGDFGLAAQGRYNIYGETVKDQRLIG